MNKLILILLLTVSSASAADLKTAPIVVTATKVQTNSFDVPMAVEVLDEEVLKDSKFSFSPADSLKRVAGLNVSDSFMSDIRVITRGFGSYSPYASRGIPLYKDGIPVSFADGFASTSLIDMNTINRTEIIKGPFSSMYGATSAGVMQYFTEVPIEQNKVDGKFLTGSRGTQESSLKYSGIDGNTKYSITHSDYSTDGMRDFSALQRNQTSANIWIDSSASTKIKVGVNNYNQTSNDYGNGNNGITVSRYNVKPYSVEDAIYNINSWKNLHQTDANIKIDHVINSNNSVTFTSWGGNRTQEQLQPKSACATKAQCSTEKLYTDRIFYGSDVRIDHVGVVLSKPYKLSVGMMYAEEADNATSGAWMTNGVLALDKGDTLTKSMKQTSTTFDQYAQGVINLTPTVDVHGGVRRTNTDIVFADQLRSAAFGGDNSGSMNYANTLPSVGVNWKALSDTNLYASYGRGAETPSILNVTSATATATSGPNTTLRPTMSDNYEIGIKTFAIPRTYATASYYVSNTTDEINLLVNTGGFKVFSNQGSATRKGIELSAKTDLSHGFGSYIAYNYIDATYDKSGKNIAGIPHDNMFGELSWKYAPVGFKVSTEMIYNGKVYATTDNTVSTDSYAIFNLKASLKQKVKGLSVTEYLAVNNIGDRVYVEAVNVDGAYSRYFATGPARNVMVGVSASYAF